MPGMSAEGRTNDQERRIGKRHQLRQGAGVGPALKERTVGEQSSRWLSQDGHPDCFELGSFGTPRRSTR